MKRGLLPLNSDSTRCGGFGGIVAKILRPHSQTLQSVHASKFGRCDVPVKVVQCSNLVMYHSKPKKHHFLSLSASCSKSCLTKWGEVPPNKISPFLRDCLPEFGYQAVSPYKCDCEVLNESNNSRDLLKVDISRWLRNRSSLIFSRIPLVVMPRAWDNGGKWASNRRLTTNVRLTPSNRNPLDKASTKDRAQYYINLAKLAEKGKITSVFFTDGYGSHEVYESSASANLIGGGHVGQLDPVPFVSPMALATETVGIVVTGSSSYLSECVSFFHPNPDPQ